MEDLYFFFKITYFLHLTKNNNNWATTEKGLIGTV